MELTWHILVGVGLVAFVGVTLYRILGLIKKLKSPRRIFDYLTEKNACKAIERGLLSAGLVRKTVRRDNGSSSNVLDCYRRSEHGSDC